MYITLRMQATEERTEQESRGLKENRLRDRREHLHRDRKLRELLLRHRKIRQKHRVRNLRLQ